MPRPPLRQILLSLLLVLLTTFTVAAKTPHAKKAAPKPPAAAVMNFDGRWSVVIITDQGACDRAYRYGVRIAGGHIFYDGDSAAVINGQVDGAGNVVVSLSYGGAGANGSGHLTESGGEGNWRGASSSASCSGRWEAERR